jgi:fructosamine-3-kinase
VVIDRTGRPWLVDPACYGGHREIDLAMLRLFGGFGRRLFAAYEDVHPLADGHRERVPLYQLYPLLVHTVLFGGAYGHQTMQALHRCV